MLAARPSSPLRAAIQASIASRSKDAADIRNLKSFALHLQVTNHGYRGEPELRATFGDNLLAPPDLSASPP